MGLKEITLGHPIPFEGQQLSSLTVQRYGNVGDQLACLDLDNELQVAVRIIARLCDVPEDAIKAIDNRDWPRVMDAVDPFFGLDPDATGNG